MLLWTSTGVHGMSPVTEDVQSFASWSRNGLGGDVPEADFWPGTTFGLPVTQAEPAIAAAPWVNGSRLPVTNFPGERIGDLASTRIAQEFISPRRRQHKGEIEALPAAQAGEWAAEKASLPVWKNPTMVVSPPQTSAPPDRRDVVV